MRFSHPFFSKISLPSFSKLFRICILGSRSLGFSALRLPLRHSWMVAAVCCELCTLFSSFLGYWIALLSLVKGWFLSSVLDNLRYLWEGVVLFLVKNISYGISSLLGVGVSWRKKGLVWGVREEKLEKCSWEVCLLRRLAGRLSLTSWGDLLSGFISHETWLLGEMMDLEVQSTSYFGQVGSTSLVCERSLLRAGWRLVMGESKDRLSFSSLRSWRSSRSCVMNLGIFLRDSCPKPISRNSSRFCWCLVVILLGECGSVARVSLLGMAMRWALAKLSISWMVSTSLPPLLARLKNSTDSEERRHFSSNSRSICSLSSSCVLAWVEAGWLAVRSSWNHTRHLLDLLMRIMRSEMSNPPKRSNSRSKPTSDSFSRQSSWNSGSLGSDCRQAGQWSTARWRVGGWPGSRAGSSWWESTFTMGSSVLARHSTIRSSLQICSFQITTSNFSRFLAQPPAVLCPSPRRLTADFTKTSPHLLGSPLPVNFLFDNSILLLQCVANKNHKPPPTLPPPPPPPCSAPPSPQPSLRPPQPLTLKLLGLPTSIVIIC